MSSITDLNKHITYVPTKLLRHIEGYSPKRVKWLIDKILDEQMWTKPLCVDSTHHLVMDGQHRMEAAKILNLPYVPCVLFNYTAVEIYSLRDNYSVDHELVVTRALLGDIYPYKTVKHRFPMQIPELAIPLNDLMALELAAI